MEISGLRIPDDAFVVRAVETKRATFDEGLTHILLELLVCR